MQIKELILYSDLHGARKISFKLGSVNTIVGASRTGKSAVGEILDYCLCSSNCDIAEGVIRSKVDWYALLLQLEGEQLFIARESPEEHKLTSLHAYYEVGSEIRVPDKISFQSNIDVISLKKLLSRKLGITHNSLNLSQGAISIRHALYYCFQGQSEIASNRVLFHNQAKDFFLASFKGSFPYLIGATTEDTLSLNQQKREFARKIRDIENRVAESDYQREFSRNCISGLIAEAQAVGLLDGDIDFDINDVESAADVLRCIVNADLDESPEGPVSLVGLQEALRMAQRELGEISDEIEKCELYNASFRDYSGSAIQQKARLQSIGLFEKLSFDTGKCPFCGNDCAPGTPGIDEIKRSICRLDKSLQNVSLTQVDVSSYLENLNGKRVELENRIRYLRSQIDGVYAQRLELMNERDESIRHAKLLGRIEYCLSLIDSMDTPVDEMSELKRLKCKLNELDSLLSADDVCAKTQCVLAQLQQAMSNYAIELDLEHAGSPYWFNENRATVYVDSGGKAIPLKNLGSGANWLGVHLLTLFAFHLLFIQKERPVPSFIFLDQPSQVFFPAEGERGDADWESLSKMQSFILNKVEEGKGKLQVILVDHAEGKDGRFAESVIERWRDGDGLIPQEWL